MKIKENSFASRVSPSRQRAIKKSAQSRFRHFILFDLVKFFARMAGVKSKTTKWAVEPFFCLWYGL
ncbi:MAG: hypothetical protein ACREUV_03100 [Burkholderiales bacterium]